MSVAFNICHQATHTHKIYHPKNCHCLWWKDCWHWGEKLAWNSPSVRTHVSLLHQEKTREVSAYAYGQGYHMYCSGGKVEEDGTLAVTELLIKFGLLKAIIWCMVKNSLCNQKWAPTAGTGPLFWRSAIPTRIRVRDRVRIMVRVWIVLYMDA